MTTSIHLNMAKTRNIESIRERDKGISNFIKGR